MKVYDLATVDFDVDLLSDYDRLRWPFIALPAQIEIKVYHLISTNVDEGLSPYLNKYRGCFIALSWKM